MMNKTEITSLLKLLEDPDDKVYQIVKDKIIDNGEMFKIYLENYHSLSIDTLALERSELLLDEIFFSDFKERLEIFLNDPKATLLQGALLLEQYFNRDVDVKQLEITCEQLIRNVWIELNDQLTSIEKIQVINRVLFREQKFRKYPVGEFREEYLSFTNCISYKKYISPTIALLYCVIAEKTDIPVYPLDIPGVFILAYEDKELEEAIFSTTDKGYIFYLHPYDEGELINPQIIVKYLKMYKIANSLEEVHTKSYTDFLFYLFELRIAMMRQTHENSFEVRYAEEVLKIYNSNNIFG